MFSIDNKVFNVNGRTKKQLELAIKLLLLDEYDKNNNVNGWYFREDKGLVLTWYVGDIVVIKVSNTQEGEVFVESFDNLNLKFDKTQGQIGIEKQDSLVKKRLNNEQIDDRFKSKVENLTPEQKEKLLKEIK